MLTHVVLLCSVLLFSASAFTPCPVQGPDYPGPSHLADDLVFKDVLANISRNLDNATEQSSAQLTDLKANETSYSAILFDTHSTLLSYHHTADAVALAPESVSEVSGTAMSPVYHCPSANIPAQTTLSTASEVSASCSSSKRILSRSATTTGTVPSPTSSQSLPRPQSLAQPN